MKISIITGASSGIGRQMALLLDKTEGCDEIWLVSRQVGKLEECANLLSTKTRIIGFDLSLNSSICELEKMLKEQNPEIVSLVNAAGFGKAGSFRDIPLEAQMNMIDLNCKALMAITYICLPYMKCGSKVYEFASKAAFQPVPYMSTYGATKAFVLSFSRALNKELQRKGIRVIAVCPGWTKTNFFDRAMKDDTIKRYDKFYLPEDVANSAVRDMNRGKDISAYGLITKANKLASKLLPHKLVMGVWCKMQDK
ncbi:MAG: SDR family NAD(P)-dependent oxidoreductase [Ruminococcaceae bacterium]|nr:SDR family NAD(P)-dependent oxidoreductase [Oscillospiraceae bacterium]